MLSGLDRSAFSEPKGLARIAAFARDPDEWVVPGTVTWSDRTVPGTDGQAQARVYSPRAPIPAAENLLVWVHGGGFSSGSLDMNEAHMVSAETVHRTGCVVVSVDYRLAGPGVHFPVPLRDVQAAWTWATDTIPHSRVHLGGASAGGALALSAAIDRTGYLAPPDSLILAYPFAHFPNPAVDDDLHTQLSTLPSLLRFAPKDIEDMVITYVGRLSNLPPLALPGAADLAGLPPTLILVSEFDDLRSSGQLLGRQMTDAGVETRVELCAGMLHGHLNRSPSLPEVDRTLNVIAQWIAG
jgi:acetyl esterase/lipase